MIVHKCASPFNWLLINKMCTLASVTCKWISASVHSFTIQQFSTQLLLLCNANKSHQLRQLFSQRMLDSRCSILLENLEMERNFLVQNDGLSFDNAIRSWKYNCRLVCFCFWKGKGTKALSLVPYEEIVNFYWSISRGNDQGPIS